MASTASTALASPSFSPTQSPSSDAGSMQRGANYFFGFLITFIALLLIFVGCGVGTRRRLGLRRRAMMGLDMWGDPIVEQSEPKFWEPWLAKAGGVQWGNMTPLSTSILRRRPLPQDSSIQLPSPPTTRGLHISSWLSKTSRPEEKMTVEEPPEALQVTVMIAMPSPAHSREREKDEAKLAEYQIGVVRVPWEQELIP